MNETIIASLIGVGGILIGASVGALGQVITSHLGHKKNLERLDKISEKKKKLLRDEMFFKKKLEHFEKVSNKIRRDLQFMTKIVIQLKNKKIDMNEIVKIVEKRDGVKFESNHILYSDDTYQVTSKENKLSDKINLFDTEFNIILKKIPQKEITKKEVTKLDKIVNEVIPLIIDVELEMRKELQK